ncbi:MAG: hypothetical protein ACE5D6_09735, partial [Candidatus Zixiibacteriota bacterium]
MKINPAGIQFYQQVNKQENQSVQQNSIAGKTHKIDKQITITPHNKSSISKLAVKAGAGNYADFLTPQEKSALDILFSRFKDSERFGPGYKKD